MTNQFFLSLFVEKKKKKIQYNNKNFSKTNLLFSIFIFKDQIKKTNKSVDKKKKHKEVFS